MLMVQTTRRKFVVNAAGASFAMAGGVFCPVLAQTEPYSDPEAADKWLAPWLHAPGAVSGALHMGRFADRMYYLDKPITWSPGPGQTGAPAVTVPKGFVTDLASIPRVFWSALPTDGVYTFPAIVHDYLYWTQSPGISRETADLIFKYGMQDMKVDEASIFAIYNAVRLGGSGPWDENAVKKTRGERRILKKFPEKPTTTWDEWRKQPAVFG